MKKILLICLIVTFKIFASGAHSHGSIKIDLAMEGNKGLLSIHGSADCFLGFEHIPKTESEKNKFKKLDSESLLIGKYIQIPEAFKCEYKRNEFSFKDEKSEEAKSKSSNHKNFIIQYDVQCSKKISNTKISFDLSKVFAEVKEIEIQFISDDFQIGAEIDNAKGSIDVK